MNKVIGIDVSKATLDAAYLEQSKWQHMRVTNNKEGFKQLLSVSDDATLFVMEASGPYYLPLARYLHKAGKKVSVENPVRIKRYAQMELTRAKTDKKDAVVIARYATLCSPKLWQPSSENNLKMHQVLTALDGISRQKTLLNNQLEAFDSSGILEKQVQKSLKQLLKNLVSEEQKLGQRLDELITKEYPETVARLRSIPGIGTKTSIMLAVLTDGFSKFNHHKQLIAYVGFSPRIYQSGSSVRGKGHICKMGNGAIRKLLYMCAWSAKRTNKACIEMYKRLKEQGKPERVIKVALANKLLKQAFAIATQNTFYNENYLSKKLVF